MYACLLREENRYPEFENVLNVTCIEDSICAFGLNDFVITKIKI